MVRGDLRCYMVTYDGTWGPTMVRGDLRCYMVTYDGTPYPGINEDADEESMLVSVMHRIVENRYFHPKRKGYLVCI